MNGFLLDTSVLSELVKPAPNRGVADWVASTDEDLFFLSVLTLGEVRKGVAGLRAGARRAKLESWLDTSLRKRFSGRVLPVDEAVAERWGAIAARAAARGRPLPVIDGLLAATALHHNLAFVTRNARQVEHAGVASIDPWS